MKTIVVRHFSNCLREARKNALRIAAMPNAGKGQSATSTAQHPM
ncbi:MULTISPECIES: hypothetical protein [unclassified Paraburkholderia]|nr:MULTISPECIES: hypothetical protein [unclassified Paraburkholderia]